jgi:hydroxyethylthiazole kinase-like uncharacterized protein yjeF
LRRFPLPGAAPGADKDGRGRVFAVAGSFHNPGAALLCGRAALKAGAGKVQLGVPAILVPSLGAQFPEAGFIPLGGLASLAPRLAMAAAVKEAAAAADAVVIGPGLTDPRAAGALLLRCAGVGAGALIADAGALHHLWRSRVRLKAIRRALILTPHHGEMATLLGVSKAEIDRAPENAAVTAARGLGAVVILKDRVTYIAAPQGSVWRFGGGTPGLATSGSGDVLAGIAAGLAARGAPALTAALWAVNLHAGAGVRAQAAARDVNFLAGDLPAQIRRR